MALPGFQCFGNFISALRNGRPAKAIFSFRYLESQPNSHVFTPELFAGAAVKLAR
jgi:hypothetical protein